MKHHQNRRTNLPLIITAFSFYVIRAALAYDTGSMSCNDIGDFAAATVVGKQNGATMKEALAKVAKATDGHPIERKNLSQIVRAIYTEPWANKLTEEGAKAAFAADCEAQKQ
jgi:hypothetical protein